MKFAFSTCICGEWDFESIAKVAAELKYGGVEVHGFSSESIQSASNLFLTDTKKLAGIFASQGVEIACLAGAMAKTGQKHTDALAVDDCRRLIDLAAELGCGLVKIPDGPVDRGQSRAAAGQALGDWLLPLGDYAAQRNVSIAIENAQGARSAREMWAILDRISHPSIGCCWNVLNAWLIGESPYVSVPTLGSRIAYAHIADARITASGIDRCKLGEGEVPVEKFLTRLEGIGYEGWVTLDCGLASRPDSPDPREFLSVAIVKLHNLTQSKSKPAGHAAKY